MALHPKMSHKDGIELQINVSGAILGNLIVTSVFSELTAQQKIHKNYLLPCYIILFLILIQGVVGWYMVKSGLVNDVTVSHYRLALHLTIAMIIISMIFWLLLNLKNNTNLKFFLLTKSNAPFLLLILFIYFW